MIDLYPSFSTFALMFTSASLLLLMACSSDENNGNGQDEPEAAETIAPAGEVYTVTRISDPVEINNEWDKEPWNSIESFELVNYMGDYPEPFPGVEGKLAYDDEAIYAIYRVEDQYVQCTRTEYQSAVFRDSAVEFFFTAGTDVSEGYFNLEMNCMGTSLFHFQVPGTGERERLSREHFDQVEIAATFSDVVEPEITEPTTWYLEYRIPFDMLEEYYDIVRPDSGVEWRANFYKIAVDTSHPHYVTWSHVENDRPNFHMPEFFGTLRFE